MYVFDSNKNKVFRNLTSSLTISCMVRLRGEILPTDFRCHISGHLDIVGCLSVLQVGDSSRGRPGGLCLPCGGLGLGVRWLIHGASGFQ